MRGYKIICVNLLSYTYYIIFHLIFYKEKKKASLYFHTISTLVPNFFFPPLLVPILEIVSRFNPCRYIRDGKCTRGKQSALLAH